MRYSLFILVSFLTLLFSSCGQDEWKVYEAYEFNVEFPGHAKDTATMEGDLAGVTVFYEPVQGSLDSNLYYSVSYYTLSDSINKLGDDLDHFFKDDVKIYAWTIGGVLADSGRSVKSGKFEGKEYKVFLAQNAGTATIRKFAKGKHLYTLRVVTEKSCLNNSQIERFMESFKLK
ncbi:MAG TPA: hypothetical protein VL651_12655 [Bacteroidia bacterium]|nr:hypothetical protein [Bacteroidia bacterium]